MKKILSTLLIGTIVLGLMAGCQKNEPPKEPDNSITTPHDKETPPAETADPEDDTSTGQPEEPSRTPDSTPSSTPSQTAKPEKPTKPEGSTSPSNKPTAPTSTPSSTPKPTKPGTPGDSATPKPENPSKLSGALEDIIAEIYALLPEDEQVKTVNTPFSNDSADNKTFFLGTSDITITEGMGSEAMISAIAHSLVLIRVPDGTDMKATMDTIKKSVNPRKWVCVGVEDENVRVLNHKNLIMLIMNNNSQAYVDAFNSLAK